ncbi:SLATT domain-containing protein [Streptomyces sp. NPDC048172]|uniref:SLATT domain-containing protein n=1 Tax=Streptomyces sp. NPDC048172 TaxID=3365505 RepID=UPI00371C2722
MSQPEMRPGDLLGRAFPVGDWAEPAERLDELYQWVEQGALTVVARYLDDRVWKRRGARALRVCAVGGGAVGGLLPLLGPAGVRLGPSGAGPWWGYLALLGAAVCLAADRCLGLTSGWMRDIATAQAVRARLAVLQYDWAAERVREVLGPAEGTAGEAADRSLAVLRRFAEDVEEIVRAETADWMVEFRTRSGPLHLHGGARALRAAGAGQGNGGGGGGGGPRWNRFPPPPFPGAPGAPGTRPQMPRQRPPEG